MTMFKNSKLVCILVLATLLAALLPVSCAGAEAAYLGQTWYGCYKINIYADKTCVIVGYHGREDRTELVIPEKLDKYVVVGIGNKALISSSVTNITIPDSVTWIGDEAFTGSSSLRRVVIGNGVEEIGSSLFKNCKNLTYVVLGNKVTEIPYNTFSNCNSLTDVVLPDGLKTIGSFSFSDCSSLMNITLPSSLERIDDYAFSECKALQTVTLPSNFQTLGNYAFVNCNPSLSVITPSSIIFIGNEVFGYTYSSPTTTVTVEEGSYMHLYCQEFGYPFVIK
jgi:hypothetical protein